MLSIPDPRRRGAMSGTLVRSISVAVFLAAAIGGAGCDDDEPPVPQTGADAATPDGAAPGADTSAPVPDGGGLGDGPPVATDLGPSTTTSLTILHTNDLHSHLQGHYPEADYTPATLNDDMTAGGFARIAGQIRTYKTAALAAKRDVLLLDGGDFMMGTLFALAGTTAAAELRFMQAVGYDAVAMGNHELDWTPKGLAAILKAASTGADKITFPILASNLKFDPASPADDDLEMLRAAGVFPAKFVKVLPSGLKVGFFGLLGAQAQQFVPTARPLTFDAIEVAATAMVADLRTNDKVDLVIALSHSGIGSDGKGEDRELAKKVPGIDVIISGHTHETLDKPAVEGKTIIVTAGSYGQYLGSLDVDVVKQGGVVTSVTVAKYDLKPIDDKIQGDPAIQAQIDATIAALDAGLAPLSYKANVAETAADLQLTPFAESGLGNLVTDAMLATAQALDPDPTDAPVIAVEVHGQIRAPIRKGKTGKIWLADLFQVTPLGIGPDNKPGAPLVTYYLSGKDIRAGLEIAAGADLLGDDVYTMQLAGMEADYNMKQGLLNRVTGLRLVTKAGAKEPIDLANGTKCYKVVTTLQLAGLFDLVKTLTGGLLSVVGKEKDCMTTADVFKRLIDSNPVEPGVQETKQFQALLGYLLKLPDTDANGIPNIPMSYAAPAGRITQTK
jgi:5'-nucleotidase / UDP-sugar diphosphatase